MTDFSNRELAELLRSLDDLNEAEFAALRDDKDISDVLESDAKIYDALQDVKVPEGLKSRLLDALSASNTGEYSQAVQTMVDLVTEATPELVAAESPRLPPADHEGHPGRVRLNRIRVVLGMLLITLCIGVGWYATDYGSDSGDSVEIAASVESWLKTIKEGNWQDATELPEWLDVPDYLAVSQPQRIAESGNKTALLDLSTSRFGSAWLVVYDGNAEQTLPIEPFKKIEVSGAYEVGAWQTNGKVYVLIVPQGRSNLDDHFDLPSLS